MERGRGVEGLEVSGYDAGIGDIFVGGQLDGGDCVGRCGWWVWGETGEVYVR